MRSSSPASHGAATTVAVSSFFFVVAVILIYVLVTAGDRRQAETNSPTSEQESISTIDADTQPKAADRQPEPVVFEPVVVGTYPHDTGAYTQGLEFVDGLLLESTGLTGESTIRLVEPKTGFVRQSVAVPDVFAEGATVVGDSVFQLTWKAETVFVRSLDDLQEQQRLSYDGEGWGLCAAEDHLVMSNGSDRLTFRDQETFEELSSIAVTDRGEPVEKLNELECVGDQVWANIWQSDRIVSIDPVTGMVEGIADLGSLIPEGVSNTSSDNVLNGIAHNDETGRFWLTGKRWPVMYEVELVAQA